MPYFSIRIFCIICLLSAFAFAETAKVKGVEWGYTVVDGSAQITGCYQGGIAKVTIPSKIGNYPVTCVGSAVFGTKGPSAITVPNGVTSLGEIAFAGNDNLKTVTLPSTLTSIPSGLFMGCKKLSSVKIPASVKSIGREAFAECAELRSVVIPEGVEKLGHYVFRDSPNLTSISIPASVNELSDRTFARCSKRVKITLSPQNKSYKSTPDALYSRDGKRLILFWTKNGSAKKLTIADGVEEIADWAFEYCTNLKELTIPASVKKLSWGLFDDCPNLSVIYTAPGESKRLKASLTAVGTHHVRCSQKDKLGKIAFKELELSGDTPLEPSAN